MKRRDLLRYTQISLLSLAIAAGTSGKEILLAQSSGGAGVTIKWLGHSCFLFTGSNIRILVNPFQTLGCTAGYRLPKVEVDLVLISSRLLDEGAAEDLPGNPKILFEPGVYEIRGLKIEGIRTPHDLLGGRRFGINTAWRWIQGGIRILHLGGAAAPIDIEEKILMGSPDLLLVPVGGGPKSYNPEQAMQAIKALNPRIVIPTMYLTAAADTSACDLVGVEQFLTLAQGMEGFSSQQINNDALKITPANLPDEGTLIRVLSEKKALKPPETNKPAEAQKPSETN